MVKMSQAFPTKYLTAADLNDREVTVTIKAVFMEEIGQDKEERPVIYFRGKEKGFVCNKTNGNKISEAYGDDSDDWHGKQITLYPTEVDYQGKQVPAIRVKIPKKGAKPAPPDDDDSGEEEETPPQRGKGKGKPKNFDKEMDDEIPF